MTATTIPTIGFFVPSGVGLGYTGPGVFLKRLIAPLAGKIDVRVYAGKRPGHETDPSMVPARSMFVGNSGPLRQIAWALTATWWVLIDRRKLDAVHFHGTYLYKILPALVCRILRIPYVLVPLASKADFSLSGKSTRIPGVSALVRSIGSRAAGGFALGEEIADELRRGGVSPNHVHVIMNPVSADFFAEPSPQRRTLLTVLFVGVIGKRKRPTLVLESLHALRKNGVGYQAIFLGPFSDSSSEQKFNDTVIALGLTDNIEHVEFSDDVSSFMLNRGSVFVLLSETEGIPGALVEAMAAGLPSVVTDAGAMANIVTSANAGAIVAPNASSGAAAIERLLQDEPTWQAASSKAREYATKHFRAEAIAAVYLEQLQAAVADRRSL